MYCFLFSLPEDGKIFWIAI